MLRARTPAHTVILLLLSFGTASVPCLAQVATAVVSDSGNVSTALEASSGAQPEASRTKTDVIGQGQGLGAPSAGASTYHFPVASQRRRQYVYDLVGPGAFISTLVQATVDSTHPLKVGYPSDGFPRPGDHPAHGVVPEWGQGVQGFAKRYGSRFGMGLVGTTTRYGLAELLRQDTSYHRCTCSGFLPRSLHAVDQSVIAHTRSGRAVPSLPALVSPFVAAEVGTVAWYPARYNASDAFRTSTSLYYGLPIKNFIKEFTGR